MFIKGNVPSSKNSKIATKRGVFHSKTVMQYLKSFGIKHYSPGKKYVEYYKTFPFTFPLNELKKLFEDKNALYIIKLHFVRGTKHKFDFINACQILFDLFTAFDLIEDDNMDYVIPQVLWRNGKQYSYDKENPGVFIEVEKVDSNGQK